MSPMPGMSDVCFWALCIFISENLFLTDASNFYDFLIDNPSLKVPVVVKYIDSNLLYGILSMSLISSEPNEQINFCSSDISDLRNSPATDGLLFLGVSFINISAFKV